MRIASTLTLTNNEKNEKRLVDRAQIVLEANKSKTNKEIAKTLGIVEHAEAKWRNRYIAKWLDGIRKEAPRKDRPPILSSLYTHLVWFAALNEITPGAIINWSTHLLAKRYPISVSTVRRIFKSLDVKPYQVKTFKIGNDKNFKPKLRDIIELLMNPPDNALVIYADEKTSI